jgi:hypothetical protein
MNINQISNNTSTVLNDTHVSRTGELIIGITVS